MTSSLIKKLKKTGLYAVCIIIAIVTGFPFVFLVNNSFKSMNEYFGNIWMFPKKIYWGNYQEILKPEFLRYFLNSVIVSSISVLIIVLVSSMISFTFARMRYRGRNILYFVIIAGMMIPVHTTLIPTFTLLSNIGLSDSLIGLIGPYVSYNIPIAVFILTQFFKEIPTEVEEAAIIDGCSTIKIFSKIIMPLSGPALSTIMVYTFLNTWNEFINANVLITSASKKTLPLGIREFYGMQSVNIPAILTAILVGSLPVILLYFFAQEKVVDGLTQGAVKG